MGQRFPSFPGPQAFLVLFSHITSLPFQGHPGCLTLAVSSSSTALALSQATQALLSASQPTHWACLSPHPCALTSSGHYLLASLSSRMLSGFSTYSQAAPHRPPCRQPGLIPRVLSSNPGLLLSCWPHLSQLAMALVTLNLSLQPRSLRSLPHFRREVPQTTQTLCLHSPHDWLLLWMFPLGRRALSHYSRCGGHSGICFLPPPPAHSKSCQSACHTSHGPIHLLPTQPLTCQGHRYHLHPGNCSHCPTCPTPPPLLPSSNLFLAAAARVSL